MDAGSDEGVPGRFHLPQWQAGYPCQQYGSQVAGNREWPIGGGLEQAVQAPGLM